MTALLGLSQAFAVEPGFYYGLEYPSGYISPYPDQDQKSIISISGGELKKLKRAYDGRPNVVRSSSADHSLTVTGQYYSSGEYIYSYTPRTMDASAFLDYRRRYLLAKQLSEYSSRALTKEQRQKEGGLLSLNIPLKSKAISSLFGEGGAGLKVSGYHQITFSGKSQWDDRASTATYRQNKFPSLNMEQISRFDINGTIGTKISVSVSQDSKTDIPLANRIIIRYKGDEDDIIKNIDAGNTNLSLPNTQFVGYSSSIQGLFGVKTSAQIGNLTMTAIASQEKGTTEKSSMTAGASASKDYLRDYQYIDGKIYDLGRIGVDFASGDVITDIDVFTAVSSYSSENATASIRANFYVDPNDTMADTLEKSEGQVYPNPVDKDNYYVDTKEHWILFDTPNAGATDQIGIWMIIKRANGQIDTIGDISSEETFYRLKLLKARNPDSSYVTWDYMWRNVYSLGTQNITDLSGLEIDIYRGDLNTETSGNNLDNQNGTPYIRILGLDRIDQSGAAKPDGLADVYSDIIDATRGLLIFPDRRPFAPDTNAYDTVALSPEVPAVYAYTCGDEEAIKGSKYYMVISNLSRAAEISLGRSNILEGSEKITLNGRQLVKGTDYNIEYDYGQVTFLTEEALDPNANINIEYEYSPYVTVEKKTLFGVRGEYEFSENLKLGSTFLYKSDKATERRPKIGQETARMMVLDADGSLKLKPNFLTGLANLFPFYSTTAPSNLAISGEVAQSYPNPNIDGVAYLDDFEGSRESNSLGIYRELWTLASRPIGLDSTHVRGKLIWYNPWDQIPSKEIWNRQFASTEGTTHTLWLSFVPSKYDRRANDDPLDSLQTDAEKRWGGIMRWLTAGYADQDQAQLLELRLQGNKGVIHFDLGNISEDVNGNDSLDTEDRESIGGFRNNILDAGEDVGLDVKPDEQEETPYNSARNPDPNGDNWYYNGEGDDCNGCGSDDYSHINGTDGNAKDPNRWGKPDTEDLNKSGNIEKINSYFSFKIDLAAGDYYVDSSEFNGWKTYRIPIKDELALDTSVGIPSWSQVNFLRIWLESPTGDSVMVKIASADLIESNWEDTLIIPDTLQPTTSKFEVAVINTQENTNYRPPSGVTGFYDKTNDITEPEQSLLLHYETLEPGDTGLAERILYDSPSLVGYRHLKMYVHGPLDVDSMRFFFRIGQDTLNYYEYFTLLKPGWDASNDVDIDFNEITALKDYLLESRDGATTPPLDTTAGNYRIFGKPNITAVKYLACGVVNLDTASTPTGDVWVDELRVTDVRRDVGLAARISASGNVADLFSYSAGYSYKNSYFRGLSSSTRGGSSDNLGSGYSTVSYNFGLSFHLDKFIPRSYGASLPVSMSYSKATSTPMLRFGTDIVLPKALQEAEKTVSVSKSLSVSESFNKKTWNPLFSVLLNKTKTSFSYSRSDSRSPSSPMSFSENYHINSRYELNFSSVPGIKPFFWTRPVPLLSKLSANRFYFIPNTFTLTGNLDRTFRISDNSSYVRTSNLQRDFKGTLRIGYKISDNLTSNYNMDTKRDMSDPENVVFSFNPKKFKLGRETSYSESFGAGYSPTIFSFLTHKFNFSTAYTENLNISDSTRNISASKSYGISGDFDFKKLLGAGRSKPSPGRGGKPDKDKKGVTVVKKKQGPVGVIINPFKGLLRFFTGWINPISYEYNERYSYSYMGLMERASLKFRFGLTESIGADIDPESHTTGLSTYTSKSTGYSLGSGTELLGGIRTDVSFNRKISRDIIKSVSPQKSVATTFPDIRFTIRPLKTFKLLNPIITRFSPRTGYTRSRSETINLQTGFKSSQKTSTAQKPLLAFSFDILKGLQINVNSDRSITEDNSYNSQSGAVTSRKRDVSSTLTISSKYSFSAPGGIKIPIFRRIKFSSTMSIAVDVSFRKQKTESASGTNPLASTGERTEFMVSPNISYSFSSQIKGGLSGRWQDTNDIAQQRKSHARELRFWVDIRF